MSLDINSRKDLLVIVNDFYHLLFQSKELKHFFVDFKNETALNEHLETLVDFWDNTLFYSGSYKKNAMTPHIKLHNENPFTTEHFEQWLKLFFVAVDQNFRGERADTIKNRASSIATVMKIKLGIV